MNKSLITGLVIGAVVATAGGAVAGFKLLDSKPTHADVLRVTPVMKTVRTPRQVCHDEVVTHTTPSRDPHNITGTVVGAVIGGVLGNQVGRGTGRQVAKVAGAAAGGYAGNRVQNRMKENDTYTTTEQRCSTVVDKKEERIGYDVRYRLGDEEGQVRMDRDPGEQIPVRDGQLVLNPSDGSAQ
jgi:uncharacterized protein YcfJ